MGIAYNNHHQGTELAENRQILTTHFKSRLPVLTYAVEWVLSSRTPLILHSDLTVNLHRRSSNDPWRRTTSSVA
jgi:hypothetical protein